MSGIVKCICLLKLNEKLSKIGISWNPNYSIYRSLKSGGEEGRMLIFLFLFLFPEALNCKHACSKSRMCHLNFREGFQDILPIILAFEPSLVFKRVFIFSAWSADAPARSLSLLHAGPACSARQHLCPILQRQSRVVFPSLLIPRHSLLLPQASLCAFLPGPVTRPLLGLPWWSPSCCCFTDSETFPQTRR